MAQMVRAAAHPTAILDPGAKIDSSCQIGPYCVVGPGVELGERCRLISHVVMEGPSKIGADNTFFPFSSIAGDTIGFSIF